jgi:hypothetical protein
VNHLSNYLPPRDMDPDWGPELSNAAAFARAAHTEVQALITKLRETLKHYDGEMLFTDLYEELGGSLEEAALTPVELETRLYEEDETQREDARLSAAEARWEARRDEDLGL